MNRIELVAAAARRMGDESTGFKALLDLEIPFVLRDLAASEALDLVQVTSLVNLTAGTRSYDVKTLLSISSPVWDIEQIAVYAWGDDCLIPRAQSIAEFAKQRASDGDTLQGRPSLWQFYPTRDTIEFHPIPDATSAGASYVITSLAEPTDPGPSAEVSQIRVEDQETIVWGLMARLAGFREDLAGDAQGWWQLYLAGRSRMKGRRFSGIPGRVEPREP